MARKIVQKNPEIKKEEFQCVCVKRMVSGSQCGPRITVHARRAAESGQFDTAWRALLVEWVRQEMAREKT